VREGKGEMGETFLCPTTRGDKVAPTLGGHWRRPALAPHRKVVRSPGGNQLSGRRWQDRVPGHPVERVDGPLIGGLGPVKRFSNI
jgi:hypothetical protein